MIYGRVAAVISEGVLRCGGWWLQSSYDQALIIIRIGDRVTGCGGGNFKHHAIAVDESAKRTGGQVCLAHDLTGVIDAGGGTTILPAERSQIRHHASAVEKGVMREAPVCHRVAGRE